MTFDLEAGLAAKEAGIKLAARRRKIMLGAAQNIANVIALSNRDGITSDDVLWEMADLDYDTSALGNAAGAIFRGPQWECIGWRPSKRVSNHGRAIRVWKLKSGN